MRAVLVLLVALAACQSFGADNPTSGGDAGTPTGTSSSSSGGSTSSSSSGGTTDGGGNLDAGTWPIGGSAGVGCSNRKPAARLCIDYEDRNAGDSMPATTKNDASSLLVRSDGSSSAKALEANSIVQGDGAYAFAEVGFDNQAKHRLAWTFDLKMGGLSSDTELFEFHQPELSGLECMLQPHFQGNQIHLNEFCEHGADTELLSINQNADNSWVNVFIDVDFDSKKVSMTVTPTTADPTTKTGSFTRTKLTADSRLKIGVSWTSKTSGNAKLLSDNFAAYWE